MRQQLVKQFGWERLSEGGLKVYTTIDPDMQRAAEANVEASVKQIEMRRASGRSPRPASNWKRRLSRWIRRPAKSARWSAAATSRPAGSIARRKRSVSPARPSSLLCMPLLSRPVIRRRRS